MIETLSKQYPICGYLTPYRLISQNHNNAKEIQDGTIFIFSGLLSEIQGHWPSSFLQKQDYKLYLHIKRWKTDKNPGMKEL